MDNLFVSFLVSPSISFSKVCERSTSPRWDEAFHFLVRDPKEELLIVKVRRKGPQRVEKYTFVFLFERGLRGLITLLARFHTEMIPIESHFNGPSQRWENDW